MYPRDNPLTLKSSCKELKPPTNSGRLSLVERPVPMIDIDIDMNVAK